MVHQLSLGFSVGTVAPMARSPDNPGVPVSGPSSRLDALRALVGAREVGMLPVRRSTGHAVLDARFGGWPRPGLVEVTGAEGAGQGVVLGPCVDGALARGEAVVVVDSQRSWWSAATAERLRVLRPAPTRAAWVAEQVAASGSVAVVVVRDAGALGRGGVRLVRAAERGGCVVFCLSARSDPALPATLRLALGGWLPDPAGWAVRVAVAGRHVREGTVTLRLDGACVERPARVAA